MNNCLQRNFELRNYFKDSDIHKSRLNVLKSFLGKEKKAIDIGCGGFMPIELAVKHACDIDKYASNLLESLNWKGKFKEASVDNLPYKDKEFNIAICSEVIEHLRSKNSVLQAFNELNRISEKWIVTTPAVYDIDPDHRFHFGFNNHDLFKFIPKNVKFTIVRKGYYFYISNDKEKLLEVTGVE